MPRRINNTLVPRNPVAKSLATRRGGAHQQSQTGVRQQNRNSIQSELANWREELAFERQLSQEHQQTRSSDQRQDEAGSGTEPAESSEDIYLR